MSIDNHDTNEHSIVKVSRALEGLTLGQMQAVLGAATASVVGAYPPDLQNKALECQFNIIVSRWLLFSNNPPQGCA